MRLAVLSDIHGNLTAFQAVLNDMKTFAPFDECWVLGDLAAFGPQPEACIQQVRALENTPENGKVRIIGGNTDRYLVTGERLRTAPATEDGEPARLAEQWQSRDTLLNWGTSQLSFDSYRFLQDILGKELSLSVPGFGHVVGYHAVPGDDEGFLTPDTEQATALDMLLDREGHLAVGGHIHRQMDREIDPWRVVNVGSVGLSFDAPGQAQWGFFRFDEGHCTVTLRSIPYDVSAAIASLTPAGYPLPDWFIHAASQRT